MRQSPPRAAKQPHERRHSPTMQCCQAHISSSFAPPYLPPFQGAVSTSTGGVPGLSWETLLDRVQASEVELTKAMRDVGALCLDGRWLSVDPGYGRAVLDDLVLSSAALGLPLAAVDEEQVVESMKGVALGCSMQGAEVFFALRAAIDD